MKDKDKYLNDIENTLSKLVTPDQMKSIMSSFNRKEPKDYIKGDIMTVEEFFNLKKDDVIHHKVYDDDGHLRSDEFDIVEFPADASNHYEISTVGCFPFEVDPNEEPTKELKNMDNSGWTWTMRKAIKK
jgi:hypothetical protein